MRPFLPPLIGTALAVYWTRLAARERIFTDYCRWYDAYNPGSLPSDLYERISHLYGEEFAEKVPYNRRATCRVLYQKTTLRHWLTDPLKLLEEFPTDE